MTKRARPLSPHLQIYRKQITSVMSIFHRISGIVLAFGAFGLAGWLFAVSRGGHTYVVVADIMGSLPGKLALFVFSLALVYHLLNGIRHLLWDSGWGYEIPMVYRSGYVVAGLTAAVTAAIWLVASRGGV